MVKLYIKFSENLKSQLNVSDLAWNDLNFNLKNHKINKAEILVTKMEKAKEDVNEQKTEQETIKFDEFNKFCSRHHGCYRK